MKISKIRSILYKSAKILGDIDAVKKGRIGPRLYNRFLGKFFSRFFK